MGLLRKARKKNDREFKRSARYSSNIGLKARYDTAYSMEKHDTKLRDGTTEYMIVTYAYALNHDFKFGLGRMTKFFNRAVEFSRYIRTNWSPASEWERALKEEAGFTFIHKDRKGYNHDQLVMIEGIETLLIIFSCAMFVEFGFRKKRLQKLYQTCTAISRCLKKNLYTLEDLERLLAKKKILLDMEDMDKGMNEVA